MAAASTVASMKKGAAGIAPAREQAIQQRDPGGRHAAAHDATARARQSDAAPTHAPPQERGQHARHAGDRGDVHAADGHQMRDAAAVEQPPILACDPAGRRSPRRSGPARSDAVQRPAHARANAVTRSITTPGPPRAVGQELRLAAHRAGGPQAHREHPAFRIRQARVAQSRRAAQHQRHAPDLPGASAGRSGPSGDACHVTSRREGMPGGAGSSVSATKRQRRASPSGSPVTCSRRVT